MESLFTDADIISRYTRLQAIEDGVLVDFSQEELAPLVREAGFKFPIAMTTTAFMECVALTPAAEKMGCDIKGRAWDVLYMLRNALRGAKGSEVKFQLYVVRKRVRPTLTTLKAVCGPGDNGEPVITIMWPEED